MLSGPRRLDRLVELLSRIALLLIVTPTVLWKASIVKSRVRCERLQLLFFELLPKYCHIRPIINRGILNNTVLYSLLLAWIMIKTYQLDCCSSAVARPMPTSGAGWQLLERSRRRFELTHNPRHLKYESYSKPEERHFRLRIIWLLSIVTQPLQSQACEGPRVEAEYCLANRLMWFWHLSVGVASTGFSGTEHVLGTLSNGRLTAT